MMSPDAILAVHFLRHLVDHRFQR